MENTSKKPRNTELIENVPLSVREGTSEEIINEIIDVLKGTKFNKISIPLTTYRYMCDESIPEDDIRITTAGYIKKFNATDKTFTVVLFANNAKAITEKYAKEDLMIEAVFTQYKDKLGIITKFVLAPVNA